VTADRAYYDTVRAAGGPDAAEISFPAYCPERRFRLSGTEVRIGRRSLSRGIDPEIDLTGPPTDPGVSRMHAVLIASPDGSWSVVDPGSENGTLVNGSEVRPGQTVPLHDGDRIHLGAWTALTITRDATALPLTRAARDNRLPATPCGRMATEHPADIGYGPGEQDDGRPSITGIRAAARARLVDPAPADRSGQGYEHVDDPGFVRRAGMPGVLGGRPRRASLGRPGWLLPGVRPEGARQPGPR
jgi:hypothetical protein